MKNRTPIILNCFSRGGSNILWNFFLTHPEACSPIQETLQIFSLDPRSPRVEGFTAAFLSRQLKLFNQWLFLARKPVPPRANNYIDHTLFRWKLKTLLDPEMKYKDEDSVYSLNEVQESRLVVKNNNGLIFLSDMFFEMYPDATAIALVRHPIPLYESHKRRRTPCSRSMEDFANYYLKMTDKMLADVQKYPPYHVARFEDLLSDPIASIQQLYSWSGLDFDKIGKVRLKAKAHFQMNGSHSTKFNEGQHYWFGLSELHQILEPRINLFQASQLDPNERDGLVQILSERMREFDYPV